MGNALVNNHASDVKTDIKTEDLPVFREETSISLGRHEIGIYRGDGDVLSASEPHNKPGNICDVDGQSVQTNGQIVFSHDFGLN